MIWLLLLVAVFDDPRREPRSVGDLAVQRAGHDHLQRLGVMPAAASEPDFSIEDTPTARFVRQVLGATAQFGEATVVAKLR